MTDIILSGFGRMGKSVYKNMNEDFRLLGNIKDIDNFSKEDLINSVIIDFSHRDCLTCLLEKATHYNVPAVIGTTGLNNEDFAEIEKASCKIPVLYSSNMSYGICLLEKFLKENNYTLIKDFDLDIIEEHRKGKIDSPSGTALTLNKSLGGKAKIHSIRAGEIGGVHIIKASNRFEQIEISHRALSKAAFAVGALRAAEFLKGREAGLYSIEDIYNGED